MRSLGIFRGTGLRIGLLGGSFNPAHGGHRHISLMAMRRLRLDAVWWLVSPQNPLKSADGMAPLDRRVTMARRVVRHPRIIVTAVETELGTQFTADTLFELRLRFPGLRFVWLMGADNLIQIDQWDRWPQIFNLLPVAVFARPAYSIRALSGRAAYRFDRFRIPEVSAARLWDREPPRWVFLHTRLDPLSATRIRAQGGS